MNIRRGEISDLIKSGARVLPAKQQQKLPDVNPIVNQIRRLTLAVEAIEKPSFQDLREVFSEIKEQLKQIAEKPEPKEPQINFSANTPDIVIPPITSEIRLGDIHIPEIKVPQIVIPKQEAPVINMQGAQPVKRWRFFLKKDNDGNTTEIEAVAIE